MDACTQIERGPSARANSPFEGRAIGWAEVAGLVEVFPDGSWIPTAKAMQYLERERSDEATWAGSMSAFGCPSAGN